MTYNHIMRSWLYSVIISKKSQDFQGLIDLEAQALSAILHDLGWDCTGELISKDKRFEVDGAIAARNWISSQNNEGAITGWDEHRTQLVWDAIALHTQPDIALYKEPVVASVSAGIMSDFRGPESDATGTLTWDEFKAVNAEFPRLDLGEGVRRIICGFAQTKPRTTYDTFMMPYGIKYVEGYDWKPNVALNVIENAFP